MGDKSKIEWTDATWNPVVGCTKVSEGCRNCYAFELHGNRHKGKINGAKLPEQYAKPFSEIQIFPDRLDQPLRWKRPRKIFVNSLSDLFHQDVPDDFIDEVFAVMALCPQHTFQVLTKRPQRMRDYLSKPSSPYAIDKLADLSPLMEQWGWMSPEDAANIAPPGSVLPKWPEWPLPNVWLGVTVENQQAADERIPLLLQTPAAIRWLSCEPLLGSVDLISAGAINYEIVNTWQSTMEPLIDWVVVGGESGSKARPMHPDWVRSLRDQCQDAGVPFLFKQWGEWAPSLSLAALPSKSTECVKAGKETLHRVGKRAAGRVIDGRTWDEYPNSEEVESSE
ncbi:phage Gp37/Gp68 family protein [Gorillibacterium sp. CAU 1737]|uniref:DUF5131 family protein n=1 Tax=Gorillibacterium sp. CAU 1737 TaxID=3140362 RepID=UPI00326055CD